MNVMIAMPWLQCYSQQPQPQHPKNHPKNRWPQTFLCNVRVQLFDIAWAVLSLQHLGQIEELVGQQRSFK